MRPDRRTILLVTGDLAMLVLFAMLGRRTHEEATGIEAIAAVAATAAPFVLGWLVATAWTARSRPVRPATLLEVPALTARTWLVGYPLALLVRAAALSRFSPWTFYLVAGLVPLALVLAWRLAYVALGRGLDRQRGPGGDPTRASSP
jgi:hypothetical protein